MALQPNSNRVPPSSPLYWTQTASPGGGVISVGAGTAITVTGTATTPVVNNVGVTAVGVGTGLSTSAATGSLTLANTGVLGLTSILNGGIGIGGTAQNPILTGTYYAGSGITVAPDVTNNVQISNTGVLSVAVGSGLSTSAASGALTLANTGVLSAVAGTAISVSSGTGDVTISNLGVTALTAGTGTSVSGSTGSVTVDNTGVLSATGGTGLSVSASTGAVTFSNTGVTSIVAGTNVSISSATGAVTINSSGTSGTVTSVTAASGNSGITIGGTAADPTVAFDVGTATLDEFVQSYQMTTGVSGGTLPTGTMYWDPGTGPVSNFTVPAGVWLCTMDCSCSCNSSTVGAVGLFQFQLSTGPVAISTCGVAGCPDTAFNASLNSASFTFVSVGANYRVVFSTIGGAFFSNGSAFCNVRFVKLGATL